MVEILDQRFDARAIRIGNVAANFLIRSTKSHRLHHRCRWPEDFAQRKRSMVREDGTGGTGGIGDVDDSIMSTSNYDGKQASDRISFGERDLLLFAESGEVVTKEQ
ncbi:hypothetical protein WA026_007003 [Henosepilachna vigintioctopunctata]|uniref:Uncharacterized protein n=1 Tax=Henosepilachna vigintioctopunctata TaxID=420089 RepID=A0AAW1V912_9CUCU